MGKLTVNGVAVTCRGGRVQDPDLGEVGRSDGKG